jgi:hypothetical protein
MRPAEVDQDRFSAINDIYCDCHTNRHWYALGSLLDRPRSWQEALHVKRRINYEGKNGYSDWRLPNIRELESLVDDSRHIPAFAPGFSIATNQITGFWSSTTSIV